MSSSPVRGARDEHDPLPEPRVVDAERHRVAHEPGAVHDLLDLGRADPVAGGLDHLVVAPDEVEEALLVGPTRSPDQTAISGRLDPGVAAGRRLEALRGPLRVVPVAQRDERAAVDELALLARLAARAVGPDDEDLGVRDRLADRVRPAVDLGRVEVGRAERLRQAVHQVRLGLREDRAQLRRASPSACARPCWRSSAGCAVASGGHSCSASWIQSGGTHVSPVTWCLAHRLHDVARRAGS